MKRKYKSGKLQEEIEKRCISVCEYIISTYSTIRETAKHFGYSKSNAYKYYIRTQEFDLNLYKLAEEVILDNKQDRHFRGGLSTKLKFENLTSEELIDLKFKKSKGENMKKEEFEIIESKELRDELISKNENVLDEIKAVPYFPTKMFVGISQAAYYYNVPEDSIRGVIKRHRSELESDGLKVLKISNDNKELVTYRDINAIDENTNKPYIGSKCRAYTIITKRALIRIGMILTKSDVAKQLRSYLLNIEESSSLKQKEDAIQAINNTNESGLVILKENNNENEIKLLSLSIQKQELLSKQELIKTEEMLKKASMYGINEYEAALLIQHSCLFNNNPEELIYEKIKELQQLEISKLRGRVRLKIETIGETYYFGKIEKVYYELSDRLKYIIGQDMQRIRFNAKKKFGERSKEVPSYLDLLEKFRAFEDAEKVLEIILEECMEKETQEELNSKYIKKSIRTKKDFIKNTIYNESNKK